MKAKLLIAICLGAGVGFSFTGMGMAQEGGQRIASLTGPADVAATQKFTFILFWKEDNPATQEMGAALKAAVAKRTDRASWTGVNVTDPANQSIVERYKVSRAPMPMVLCIAPNGAITGGIPDRVTEEAVERALVTPTMTQCMKALQEGKLVLVHVRQDNSASWPKGARDFAADPGFQSRTTMVGFRRDDPNEKKFLTDMEINDNTNGSLVALLAPPGVLVGKYSENVTKDQMASALHAAGKCCNDPNCKNNKKGN